MSEKIIIIIDGKEITTDTEKKLLWVALDNDIYIPNLCAIREEERPYAGCRLCFVENRRPGRTGHLLHPTRNRRYGGKNQDTTGRPFGQDLL